MLSVPLGLLGSCGTLLGQLSFFDLQNIKFWDPFVSATSRQLLQMVPKVLICWRDDCNDRGLRATWLSQSSYNLPCSLIRFARQSGSINQAVRPATAATLMSNCDQWSFQFVMGLDTSAKAKTIPPRTTRASCLTWPVDPPAVLRNYTKLPAHTSFTSQTAS